MRASDDPVEIKRDRVITEYGGKRAPPDTSAASRTDPTVRIWHHMRKRKKSIEKQKLETSHL
jgi:hypothetical protein